MRNCKDYLATVKVKKLIEAYISCVLWLNYGKVDL